MKKITILILTLLIFSSQRDLLAMDQEFITAIGKSDIGLVRTLIENGANVNVEDDGDTYLIYAVNESNPNIEIIRILIDNGANVNVVCSDGYTLLMLVISKDYFNPDIKNKIIRILLECGADVNDFDNQGDTSLMFATMFNTNPEIIRTLVEAGADVNAFNDQGNTVLMLANMLYTSPEVIRMFLENGADVNHANYAGDTSFSFAGRNGYIDIIKIFLEYSNN